MGKRSDFPRVEGDAYYTPRGPVEPLIPHLRRERVRTFAEPCCGDGALVRHLESVGLRCVYAGDIVDGRDALATTDYNNPDRIITNPPFSKENTELLFALIAHFLRIAQTWLLLPADRIHNENFLPLVPMCSHIVSVRRIRWIAGTKSNSMDNFAWLKLDSRHRAGPVFCPKEAVFSAAPAAICANAKCGKPYRPHRSDSRYCSNGCRQCAYRERLSVTQV
jgi:hypothetical protein